MMLQKIKEARRGKINCGPQNPTMSAFAFLISSSIIADGFNVDQFSLVSQMGWYSDSPGSLEPIRSPLKGF